jgi:hypothetical protein
VPSELSTLAAPLAPFCALLPSLVLGVGAVVGVEVGVAVLDVVVVAGALLLVVAEVAAVVVALALLFVLLLVLEAFEPPGTSPSWLSAEKMLSMNPIMPPDCWPSCTLWSPFPPLSSSCWRAPCARWAWPLDCVCWV